MTWDWARHGQLTVSASPRPLTTDRSPCRDTLVITALRSNSGPVYIGSLSNGYPLDPGRELSFNPSNNLTLARKPGRSMSPAQRETSWHG
jgi:hypothetical protein